MPREPGLAPTPAPRLPASGGPTRALRRRLGIAGPAGGEGVRRSDLYARAAQHALFALVPILFTAFVVRLAIVHDSFAVDFRYAFWPAGERILHGLSPYVGPNSPRVAAGVAFVYPAVGAVLFSPWALMPNETAQALFAALDLAAALGTLRVLGIRDWRLYGLVTLMPAVISGWQTGNITLLILFAVGVMWRWRDRPGVAGALVALIVSVKLFAWPLALWLLATRRYAAFAWAAGLSLLMNLAAWAVIGFPELGRYARLISAVTEVEERSAYTVLALAAHLGAGLGAAHALALAAGAVAALGCGLAGRCRDDRTALLLAITAALLSTPIVWRHYFALLIVPLALARPRLSGIWLVPLLLYICPVTSPQTWQLALALGSFAAVVGALLIWPSEPLSFRRLGLHLGLGATRPTAYRTWRAKTYDRSRQEAI